MEVPSNQSTTENFLQLSQGEFDWSESERVFWVNSIQHFLKNKFQGIEGGSFLVESGLKSSNIDLIQKGWRIVRNCQDAISRSALCLLMLQRPLILESTPANLAELVERVIETQDSYLTDSLPNLPIEIKVASVACVADFSALQVVLQNLIRYCSFAGATSESSRLLIETGVAINQDSAWIRLTTIGFDVDRVDLGMNNDDDGEDQFRIRIHGLEWVTSLKIIARHGGTIQFIRDSANQTTILIDLPAVQNGNSNRVPSAKCDIVQ